MSQVTISEFATDIGIAVEQLQEQLVEAGLSSKTTADLITDAEKNQLLAFLRKKHGKDKSPEIHKITLKRKTVSELKIPVATQGRTTPRSKMVSIEFRKRRTYAKRSDITETLKQEEAAKLEAQKIVTEAKAVKPKEEVRTTLPAEQTVIKETTVEEKTATEGRPEKQTEKTVPDLSTLAKQEKPVSEKQKHKSKKEQIRYGRAELHVTTKGAGRRRKKSKVTPIISSPTTSKQHGFEKPVSPIVRNVDIPESITVAELAQKMSVKSSELIKVMMGLGMMVTINQMIDQETAAIVVEEMGHNASLLKENTLEEDMFRAAHQHGEPVPRAPVVTVMGHVDHGKTSLLDYIRRTKIAASEVGGITQHIGAYCVRTDNGQITFLDTPGHEAFTAMRARGAKVTDIVVIVVAADDGVMPQTEEAITHAKAGNVPIIIAVNKIDKENADLDRVKQELSKCEVISEDWGGDTIFVNVSAKTGQGIDGLLESILLTAEILELNAIDKGPAIGTVIESRLDKGRGPVASILVQSGCLQKGDIILSGHEFGRVRAMIDDGRNEVISAGPSTPVEVLGLSGTSYAGDELLVVPDEKKAREIALFRQGKYRETKMAKQETAKLEKLMSQMQEEEAVSLNLLIKADVQGSAEALVDALTRLANDEVKVNVISSGVGGITESDINFAMASRGIVFGFNVRADASARKLADLEGIDLRYYSIIYDVIDDVKAAINGLLSPEIREQILGIAEVRDIFHSPKFGDIAGCMVTSGCIRRNNPIRVLRDNVVIYEGELESLRRFKEDVNEVKSGIDCGIGIKNYNDIRIGDQIEVFERVSIERKIE